MSSALARSASFKMLRLPPVVNVALPLVVSSLPLTLRSLCASMFSIVMSSVFAT